MAGIGFELRRVIDKKGIGSFFQIALSGAVIVAGPWLLAIITISLLKFLTGRTLGDGLEMFMGVVIYSYAFSLFLFGGFHYLFTRRMSDLLYLKKEGEAFGYVLRVCLPVSLISVAISAPAAASVCMGADLSMMFGFSSVLFFTAINCLWIVMLFVSVLKWYIRIMIVYTAGFGAALAAVYYLSRSFGLAGAMLGFSGGHLLIVVLLIILCRLAWKPERPSTPHDIGYNPEKDERRPGALKAFLLHFRKHRFLFGAGLLYYWGIWIDKIIYWIVSGSPVNGTFIRLFEIYDIPVFLANLSMIPGLIFFIIWSETEFYTALKNLLLKIQKGRYAEIAAAKSRLSSVTWHSLREQSLLQAIVTASAMLLVHDPILRVVLAAVFFHLMLLTLMNYLFYIEQYRHAFFSAAVFVTVNAAAAVIMLPVIDYLPPGSSYLAGAAAAAATAAWLLKGDIFRLERHILTKNY